MSDNLNSEEELGASRFAAIAKAEYEKQALEDWQAFKPKLLKVCLEAAEQGRNDVSIQTSTRTSSWIVDKLSSLGYNILGISSVPGDITASNINFVFC